MITNQRFWEGGKSRAPHISVFAVDPGETSGWCWMLKAEGTERFVHGEVNTWEHAGGSLFHCEAAHARRLMSLVQYASESTEKRLGLKDLGVTHVVCEDFTLRLNNKNRALLSPVRLTTGLFNELNASELDLHFHLQSASDGKTTVTDEMLRSMGLWFKGQQHARDAARHLVTFLRRYK